MNVLKIMALAVFVSPALVAFEDNFDLPRIKIDKLDVDLNDFGEVITLEDPNNFTYLADRKRFSGLGNRTAEQLTVYFNKKDQAYGATNWQKYFLDSEAGYYYEYTPTIAKLLFVKLQEKHQQQLKKDVQTQQPQISASRPTLLPCPNPDCSKKIDARPKTKKEPGMIYHAGYSYRAHCPTCGDERDIKFFDN